MLLWLYGTHTVLAALKNPHRQIKRIVSIVAIEESPYRDLLAPHKKIVEMRDKSWFANTFGNGAVHQGLCLQVAPLNTLRFDHLLENDDKNLNTILVLDQLTDPQNIGAILRSAVAFGVHVVIVPARGGPELTPALCKCACGALEHIAVIYVPNLVQALVRLKKAGYWCVGLEERGCPLPDLLEIEKIALIVGGEGSGMRRLTRINCDFLVRLPTVEYFSTLNAAQSATIALYEFFCRKENQKK